MSLGDNAKTVLKQYVDELYALRSGLDKLKTERKNILKDLKDEGLPAAEISALLNSDEDKDAEKAKKRLIAAALLQKPVFAEQVSDDELKTVRDGYGEGVKELVEEHVEGLRSIDEEIGSFNADIKAKKKEIKAGGFSPDLVNLIVDFKIDPASRQKHADNSMLLTKYLEAIDA